MCSMMLPIFVELFVWVLSMVLHKLSLCSNVFRFHSAHVQGGSTYVQWLFLNCTLVLRSFLVYFVSVLKLIWCINQQTSHGFLWCGMIWCGVWCVLCAMCGVWWVVCGVCVCCVVCGVWWLVCSVVWRSGWRLAFRVRRGVWSGVTLWWSHKITGLLLRDS